MSRTPQNNGVWIHAPKTPRLDFPPPLPDTHVWLVRNMHHACWKRCEWSICAEARHRSQQRRLAWSLMDLGVRQPCMRCALVSSRGPSTGTGVVDLRLAWFLVDLGVVNRGACVVLGNNGGLRGLSWICRSVNRACVVQGQSTGSCWSRGNDRGWHGLSWILVLIRSRTMRMLATMPESFWGKQQLLNCGSF
jgi:hypothetical protein